MGASKDTFTELRIQAEMSEETYTAIPAHLRDEMNIKRIDMPNYRELYEKDVYWQELNDKFIDSLKRKKDRETEIRINNQLNN